MFAQLFRPKWQHPKAEKRVKAVAKLRAGDAKALTILSRLAVQDDSELVRVAATEKLDSVDLLIKISQTDTADNVRQQALHKLSQLLLVDEHLTADDKQRVLLSVKDNGLLAHLALNSTDESLRKTAIEQIDDAQHLLAIAEQSQRASVRLLAAEQIDCPATLETLSKAVRNKDKGVYKIAREKLQQIKAAASAAQALQEQLDKLISAAEQLAETAFFPLYQAKLSAIISDWDKVESKASPKQILRFKAAQNGCQEIIKTEQARQADIDKKAAALAEHKSKVRTLLQQMEQLQQQAVVDTAFDQADDISKQLQSLSNAWQQLNTEIPAAQLSQFNRQHAQLSNFLVCQGILSDHLDLITAIINSDQTNPDNQLEDSQPDEYDNAKALLQKISWPQQYAKPEPLLALETWLTKVDARRNSQLNSQIQQRNKQSQQLLNELTQALDQLENLIDQGAIKTADKTIKRAEQLSKRLNGELPANLDQRSKTLNTQLQEIKDWQAYAITPKKEALCETMEALIASELPLQERAASIRKVQKEWKQLDATDSNHSQKLWVRFKQASDQAYAPCDEFYREQKQLRTENLKNRQALCEQLEQRGQQQLSNTQDWQALADEIHRYKQQWRDYSPVDRAPGKKLQATFDQWLNQLEQPLKDYYGQNAQDKKQLIQQAKALADDPLAADGIKALQQQWKSCGPAARNQEHRLWQQFKQCCNEVLQRTPSDKTAATPITAHDLTPVTAELEQALNSACKLQQLQQTLTKAEQRLQQASKSIGDTLSPEYVQLEQKAESARQLIQEQSKILRSFEAQQYQNIQEKAALCDALEQALFDGEQQQVTSLEQRWQTLPDSDDQLTLAVTERFKTLIDVAAAPETFESIAHAQEDRLRQLCIRLEIATSAPSPIEDQALRMEYQMARLEQALDQQEQTVDLRQIKQLQFEWMCIPFANQFETLQQRFTSQLNQVL